MSEQRHSDTGIAWPRRKAGRLILAVSVVLLVSSFVTTVNRTRARQQAALDARLTGLVADRTRTVAESSERARSLVLALARNPAFAGLYTGPPDRATAVATGAPQAGRVNAALAQFQQLYQRTATEFGFIDRSGAENARVVNGHEVDPTDLSPDRSGQTFFHPVLGLPAGQSYEAEPFWSSDSAEWVLSAATVIRSSLGTLGVLHFERSLEGLRDAVADESGETVTEIVDRRTGSVIADSRTRVTRGRRLVTADSTVYPFLAGGAATSGATTVDGRRLLYRAVPASDGNHNDWAVVVSTPQVATGILAGLDGASLSLAASALLLLVLVGLTARTNQRRLHRVAMSDGLTGLPNRNRLLEAASEQLAHAERDGRTMALLLLDLDRFKEINDTLGHQWGDRLLQEIGPRIQPAIRQSDLVARLGGDEFVILLRDAGDEDTARRVAERIVSLLEQPFQLGDLACGIEASIGIALGPRDGADVHTLLQHADVAMYVAKQNRHGVTVYEPTLDLHNPRKLSMLGELRVAIEQRQLVLHYQPMNSLFDGARPGVEALVRWEHPERGLIPPDEFIPLAEHTALIQPLTAYVLDEALAQCRRWLDGGHEIAVAVNVSARSLHDPSFYDLVVGRLAAHGVGPELLDLEITESAIMVDPKGARELLGRLHDLGVRLSIDDFGTGYSSLAYLKTLPVHTLKIDRSFVRGLEADHSDAVIVQSVIDLGRNLGLSVVAEGVEDAPTAERLARLGCSLGQGWFWSRAVPADQLADWVVNSPVLAAESDAAR